MEFHRRARNWMEEFELVRMERQPPRGIALRAVLAIANYRMAEAGHLHANLILSAGFDVSSTSGLSRPDRKTR